MSKVFHDGVYPTLIEDMSGRTLGYIGATMSPIDAWLTLMSVETLPLRMDRICDNALTVAQHLEGSRVEPYAPFLFGGREL